MVAWTMLLSHKYLLPFVCGHQLPQIILFLLEVNLVVKSSTYQRARKKEENHLRNYGRMLRAL